MFLIGIISAKDTSRIMSTDGAVDVTVATATDKHTWTVSERVSFDLMDLKKAKLTQKYL